MSFKYSDNPFYNKKQDYYRVYLNMVTNINEDSIEKFMRETIKRNYLYTDANILEILKEKDIVKIDYIDVPVYSKTICKQESNSELTVLIDKSKEKHGENVFQIPVNHYNVTTKMDIYSITPKSNLKFNIIKINDEIVDFYFTTNEDLEHGFIKEELFTFVSLLN